MDVSKRTAEVRLRPMVLSHQSIRFETAQSWNQGKGNLNHPGKGNNGINYPNDSYDGERPKDWFY